jgi:hypothetical protein
MPSHPIHQFNTTSLKEGLKNIRRRTPSLLQKSASEKQLEVINQDTKSEADFIILATQLKEINLISMPSSMHNYIIQKTTPIQIKVNQLRQAQQISENSTKWADVCDCEELEDVLDRLEKKSGISPCATIASNLRNWRGNT